MKEKQELGYPPVCKRHCTVCEGADHHWLPDVDDDTGDMVMACMHCPAKRSVEDRDIDDLAGFS